jgi:hypothetical protein
VSLYVGICAHAHARARTYASGLVRAEHLEQASQDALHIRVYWVRDLRLVRARRMTPLDEAGGDLHPLYLSQAQRRRHMGGGWP